MFPSKPLQPPLTMYFFPAYLSEKLNFHRAMYMIMFMSSAEWVTSRRPKCYLSFLLSFLCNRKSLKNVLLNAGWERCCKENLPVFVLFNIFLRFSGRMESLILFYLVWENSHLSSFFSQIKVDIALQKECAYFINSANQSVYQENCNILIW